MKFHDELNQKLFNKEELKPEVKEKLKEIAEAFIEYLEVDRDAIKDVVITGSSVSYNYTKYSDIDLHLKVDYDLVHEDCPIVEGYLWACKTNFNKEHDISIYGVPVELYAESIEEDTVHNGLYSLWQDKWIDKPNKIPPTDNDGAVLSKYNEIKDAADRIQDSEVASELIDKIYQMRKSGLQQAGEFSTENLAFKKLRDEGVLERLRQMKKQKIDKELSLESYNESMDYIETAIKELKETGNLKGSTILQSHCLNVGDEVIGPWEQPCKVKEYNFEESRIRYNLVNINDPRDTYEHLTAEDLAGYGNKINYEQELTSILYMEDHGKQEDLITTSYGIWSKLFKNGPIYLIETQDNGYYSGYICVTTDRMESIKELAQICEEEEAVEDLLTERKNIPCKDLYNLLASTNESVKSGFKKGDKVQLRRKNNKIGIVKSIFNGDKDKNDKDIKYLDVEFEDGTKEGRPASDFKKVKESFDDKQFTNTINFNSPEEFKQDLEKARKEYKVVDQMEGKDLLHLVYKNGEHIATYNNTKLEKYTENLTEALHQDIEYVFDVTYKDTQADEFGEGFDNDTLTITKTGDKEYSWYSDALDDGGEGESMAACKKAYKDYLKSGGFKNIKIKNTANESLQENKPNEIVSNFKDMVNKIASDFKAEGYPKSNKFLLDYVKDEVDSFMNVNPDYKVRISTDNGTAVLTLIDVSQSEDNPIYQGRINSQNSKVRFSDIHGSNYMFESLTKLERLLQEAEKYDKDLDEDAQTLTDKVDKAEQDLQDLIKMVKVGYQEDKKLINNLNKLINEALEE